MDNVYDHLFSMCILEKVVWFGVRFTITLVTKPVYNVR